MDARAVDAHAAESMDRAGLQKRAAGRKRQGWSDSRLAADRAGPPVATPADSPVNADQPAIDDGMKWIVDFDAAEKVGMGIRARLATRRTPPRAWIFCW